MPVEELLQKADSSAFISTTPRLLRLSARLSIVSGGGCMADDKRIKVDNFQLARLEIERLRQLVDERPDWNLWNWGCWSRGDRVGVGFPGRSTSLESMSGSGVASEYSSQIADEKHWPYYATVSDQVIDDLPERDRLIIDDIYRATCFTFRRGIDAELVEAANRFWEKASRWLN